MRTFSPFNYQLFSPFFYKLSYTQNETETETDTERHEVPPALGIGRLLETAHNLPVPMLLDLKEASRDVGGP